MPARLIFRAGALALGVTLGACGGNGTSSLPLGPAPPSASASGAGSNVAAGSAKGGQDLYLASRSDNSILVFPAKVHGNKAPTRRIAGSKTKLLYPLGLAVDAGGKIYVANDNGAKQIEIFSANANGNATPKLLGGPSTGFVYVQGLAVDGHGKALRRRL